MRPRCWTYVAALSIILSGCRQNQEKTGCDELNPRPDLAHAFDMQTKCVAMGKLILDGKAIPQRMAKDQVSKYNAADNRCYVLLSVHDAIFISNQKMTSEDSLYDGQTGELLAVITGRGENLELGLLDDSMRPMLSDPKNPYEVWKLAEKLVRIERKIN